MIKDLDYEQCYHYMLLFIRLLEITVCFIFGPLLVDPQAVVFEHNKTIIWNTDSLYIFSILFFLANIISSCSTLPVLEYFLSANDHVY